MHYDCILCTAVVTPSCYWEIKFLFVASIVRKKSEKDAYLRRYRHFVKKRF